MSLKSGFFIKKYNCPVKYFRAQSHGCKNKYYSNIPGRCKESPGDVMRCFL